MTMYDQIKMVPPNHFFECEARTVIRHYPLEKRDPVTVDMAATIASKLLMNIITGYHKQFRLSLPLTSGLDSRTILAMCRDIMDDVPTYTFFFTITSPRIRQMLSYPPENSRATWL